MMQIFVKSLSGKSIALEVEGSDLVERVKERIEEKEGIDVGRQTLLSAGRLMTDGRSLDDHNIRKGETLQLTVPLRGGVPMKVKMMTDHLSCGSEVNVDIDPADTLREVKEKLEKATGVPKRAQKVLLAGIGEIAMGDKRTNVKFSKCGTANNMSLATMGHENKQ